MTSPSTLSLSLVAAATLALATQAGAVTPGPTPVVITNGPLSTVSVPATPFLAMVTINIANGSNAGSANGNFTGTQSVAIPAGKRLVAESISAYRYGSMPSGSIVQVYVDTYQAGNYGAWPIPPIVANGTLFPGGAAALKFYADGGGTNFLVNAYRNSTVGAESVAVNVSGYLVDMP